MRSALNQAPGRVAKAPSKGPPLKALLSDWVGLGRLGADWVPGVFPRLVHHLLRDGKGEMTDQPRGAILKPEALNKLLAVGAAPGAAMYLPEH